MTAEMKIKTEISAPFAVQMERTKQFEQDFSNRIPLILCGLRGSAVDLGSSDLVAPLRTVSRRLI
jgi:hypothetical protein